MEWISMALLYLQDDAAIWAAPAMEEFANREGLIWQSMGHIL